MVNVTICNANSALQNLSQLEAQLSLREQHCLQKFSIAQRKQSFLLGRHAARLALEPYFPKIAPFQIEIMNSSEPLSRGMPQVFLPGETEPTGHLSITHRDDWAAACFHPKQPIGIDLELVETRDPSFQEDHFTRSEKELICLLMKENDCAQAISVLWSAKEAMSKALGKGLSLSTLQMESSLDSPSLLSFLAGDTVCLSYFGSVRLETKLLFFSLKTNFLKTKTGQTYVLTLAIHSGGKPCTKKLMKH